MSAIETLRAYRTLRNADNVDDAIAEIQRSYERLDEQAAEIDRLRADIVEAEKYNGWHQQAVIEIERLRAENAKLRDDIAAHLNTILYLQLESIRAKAAKEE